MIETKKDETNTAEKQLRRAMATVAGLYSIDAGLVAEGAKKHGVRVIKGNLITPLSPGNYNPRIPEGTDAEVQAIKAAKKIAFICEDFRQSYYAAQHLEADVVFASAGGPVQPDDIRFAAAVELAAAMHKINPNAHFVFAFHTHVCGGADYFTHGEMQRKFIGENGEAEELKSMTEDGIQFAQAVMTAGVPKNLINLNTVDIKQGEPIHGASNHVQSISLIAST